MYENLEILGTFAKREISMQYNVMLDASIATYSFSKHHNSNVKSSNV